MSSAVRITVDEYDRLIDSGYFQELEGNRRVELIRGEIVEMSPIGSPHEEIVDRLNEWSIRSFPRNTIRVRVQNSVGLPELDSVPQSDLAWVKPRSYRSGRPKSTDVLLVIEVADSSLRHDLKVKAPLFAEAGIQEYWVIDVNSARVHVFHDPEPNGYATVRVVESTASLAPLAFPETPLDLKWLFA
ncbi:MAG: Uma2 family endonuclease [Planctomycetota bacterium]|nr:Uma2 family endonuclease [Planctomycetota bacterium]